ncbi:MAG: hypothetical protein DRI57_28770 [Deltaproteobacteria bacterium]|nr:MAG: hypothetical protein DRI57_28770 [Deltaproteobacteria bacterium]
MISEISLENFKAFSQLKGLNIKPVTILCGANSCGKSSVLQSILLMKQSLESRNLNQPLLLNGRFVQLGTFRNIIFEKDPDREISFEFFSKIRTEYMAEYIFKGQRQIPWRDIFREILTTRDYSDKDTEYDVRYKVSLKAQEEKKNTDKLIKPFVIKNLSFNFKTEKVFPSISLEMTHDMEDSYLIRWKKLRLETENEVENEGGELSASFDFANIFPTAIKADEKRRQPLESLISLRITEIMKKIFDSYSYIGPLREKPSRKYLFEDEILEIGLKGENAAYIYLTEQHTDIDQHYFYDKSSDAFVRQGLKLGTAVQQWLNAMNIKAFNPEFLGEMISLRLNSSLSSMVRVNIADVGFGVSQIFPIILEGLRMPRGYTLLLEQPEIHLHPNLQMQMADYFISLALSGKNIIAETHSDHVVNRLVRRIVEDESGQLQNMIGIYFLKSSENGAVFEEIHIDESQGITNWPEDFFDQTATEQEKIMRAGLKKRKKLREQKKGLCQ